MNIAVIAANGRSGQAFVTAALAAGHTIHAGIHGASNFSQQDGLMTMQCDATRPSEVSALISGCDAVVSLIGHVPGSAATVQTDSMRTIIECMKQQHVSRIISLTGTGVRQPGDHITLTDRLLNMSISIIDPARVQDGKGHAKLLSASGLEWTILRVLKLQNVTPKPFILTENGPTRPYVGRVDVARAIVEVIENHSFIQKMPILSKTQ